MDKNSNTLGTFTFGMLIGLGIGLLFAPKSGTETRSDIKNKFNSMMGNNKDDLNFLIELTKEKINDSIKSLKKEKVLEKASEKVSEIKEYCDEIIEMSLETGGEAIEKATKKFKKDTLKTIDKIIDKLEA